jgi:hypothetical protein
MVGENLSSPLSARSGREWLMWFGNASVFMPDMHRALQFLENSCELMDSPDEAVIKNRPRKLKQLVNKFVGQARCPTPQSCEKIAVRTQILHGWLQSELKRSRQVLVLLELGAHALQKLFAICEGADDKHGVLIRAVRELVRDWLSTVSDCVENPVERAYLVYPVAMLDQAGLVDPLWWWKQIAACDRNTVLGLADAEIADMAETQPSSTVSWRSFDRRWRRLRLKSLLEHLEEKRLLAELLRKSAVDDFEAVQAVRLLRECGRSRDAIVQAEQWLRVLPRSPLLAEVLYELYLEDGWDDEALSLAKIHYGYDPNPVWIERLRLLNTVAARQQLETWGRHQPGT